MPIQPAPFVYSEVALQRFDFVLNALAQVSPALVVDVAVGSGTFQLRAVYLGHEWSRFMHVTRVIFLLLPKLTLLHGQLNAAEILVFPSRRWAFVQFFR